MYTWHDSSSIRYSWPDAASLDHETLRELLKIAKEQVIAYAPKSVREALDPTSQLCPDNLRYAQRRQAENLWNAARVDSSGGEGPDGFRITPHPLDWHICQIIRPRRAVPIVR